MTPRERWQAVLAGERADRTPTDIWATDEAVSQLQRHTATGNRRELYAALHIDAAISVAPRYVGPPFTPDTDEYGIGYRNVSYGAGSYREAVRHPLAGYGTVDQIIDGYRWPSADWYDYSEIAGTAAAWPDHPIRGGGSEPFLKYIALRGREQALMDLIENPEIVHYCLDRLFAL